VLALFYKRRHAV